MGEEINIFGSGLPVPKKTTELAKRQSDLVDQIIDEENVDKFNELTALFQMNQKKKNIARVAKLSSLLDIIDNETLVRFTEEPEAFDNDQLVKYMDVTQKSITNIENTLEKAPLIQINNQKNEINIASSGLTRESRRNVLEAVRAILDDLGDDGSAIDVDFEELEEEIEEE